MQQYYYSLTAYFVGIAYPVLMFGVWLIIHLKTKKQ